MKLHKHGFLCLLLVACAASGAANLERADADLLQEAQLALDSGDPDRALAITDKLLQRYPDRPDVHLVAAAGNVALAGLNRRGLDNRLVLEDAAKHFAAAASLTEQPGDAYRGLAEVRYQMADFDGARDAAAKAVKALQLEQPADLDGTAAALIIAAKSDLQYLVALRQQEMSEGKADENGFVRPGSEALKLADSALQKLEAAQRRLPAEGFRTGAMVYQWIGQNDNAAMDLERGIRAAPKATELHEALLQLYLNMQQPRALEAAYGNFSREMPDEPLLRWYRGRALVALADDLRARSQFTPAMENYRLAGESFSRYANDVPAHYAAAQQWIAICELSIARVAVDAGDLATGKAHLYAAADASPLALEYDGMMPQLMDSFRSHFAGVVFAISRTLSESGRDPLADTLAFNEEIIARYPDKWGFVYNNAALPARDLGVRITQDLESLDEEQRKQALSSAMELWERSYQHYEKAVELSPDDARIVNDCGLMLIYHLNRDFDRAQQCFEKAIAVGQPQLDAMAADAPREDRNLLEEAVGDAWQNLGVLSERHLHRPFTSYEEYLEKAITYYPYKRREAWRMLQRGRQPTDTPAGAPGGGLAAAQVALAGPATGRPTAVGQQGNDKEAFDKLKNEVDRKLQDNDLDGALTLLDRSSKQLKGYAPYQALRGDISLRHAIAARDAGRTDVEFLFQDAVTALSRAVDMDSEPSWPRVLLAQAQYESGGMQDAVGTANSLLLHLQSQGGGTDEEVTATHRVRANAAARVYVQDKSAKGAEEMLRDARNSFRLLEERKLLDAGLGRTWSAMEATAGAAGEAVGILQRQLAGAPDDMALLGAVVDTAANVGEAALAVEALAGRTDAAGLWFLGKARYYRGAEQRAAADNKAAIATLQQAKQNFERSKQENAGYAQSCDQWIAVCLGKMGNAAITEGDLDSAEDWLLKALEIQPQRISDDLGLGDTTKLGVMILADKYAASDPKKTEAIYRRAVRSAYADPDLLNNAGLFSRDVGEAMVRSGASMADAKDYFEASYDSYKKAVELDPNSVRLRNDCALLAVHWLERDWDDSRRLLNSAIEDGQQQLDGFQGVPEDRRQLDEAVGDCYENLALWHLKHSGDAEAAKAAAEKSLEFYPGARRPGANRHLREAQKRLEGK
jgi:hypothetical protein